MNQPKRLAVPRLRRSAAPQSGPIAERLARMGPMGTLFSAHFKSVELHLNIAIAGAWSKYEMRTGTNAALAMIVANPGISQNEVARTMHLDKSGVNAIVNILEAQGWAERRRSPADRRRNNLYALPAGEAALDQTIAELEQAEARMLAGLSPEDRAQLVILLDRLNESLAAAEGAD